MNKQQSNMPRAGKESIKKVKRSVVYIMYNYLHTNGACFKCIKQTLEDCRKSRDLWLENCCQPDSGRIVYGIQSTKSYLIFNPNIKGYVLLIETNTAQIQSIHRNQFFGEFSLLDSDNQSGRMNNTEAYELMLKAYHLQFSKKKR
ncbi:DUF3873 family protein [Dysgonomonas termitidis]|uniref:DUF3873 family protein n=1 Tax=Dysgonomonas termitidis TaxID=1516126 RepID=A0ABV9L046_9BACT